MIRFYAVPMWVRMWRQLMGVINRVPYWARVISLAVIMAVIVGFAWMQATKDRYQLSDAQMKLLGISGIEASKIKETPQAFTYNMGDDMQEESVKKVVLAANASDSTALIPYQASIPKDPKDGLTFGDAKGQLSFSMVPEQKAGEGRKQEGRVVYPVRGGAKSVYTFKRNGIKEDILLERAPGKEVVYSWGLSLGEKLEARMLPDGGVGIYAASPYLYDDLQVADDKSRTLVDKARKDGEKEYLLFALPQPFMVEANGKKNFKDVAYSLDGDTLTLKAQNLDTKTYPISIDPTVVVTTSSDFGYGTGYGIDYGTADQVKRGDISLGTTGGFSTNANYFNLPRRALASIAYNGYLYIIGGSLNSSSTGCKDPATSPLSSTECSDVQMAQIDEATGSVGSFTTTSYFVTPRSDVAATIYNGYLYIAGGGMSSFVTACKNGGTTLACNDVQYAKIDPNNGTVVAFTPTSYFSDPRNGHAVLAYNGYLYIVGGNRAGGSTSCKNVGASSSQYCNDIQYAPINADGSLGSFVTSTNYFSLPRWLLAGAIYNGYLYVMGGDVGSSTAACKNTGTTWQYCNDVQYAKINADGSVGTFQTNSTYFSIPRAALGSAVYGGYLYIVGGIQVLSDTNCKNTVASTRCNDVQYAPINADGSVGTFANASYFLTPRDRIGTAVYKGKLYVAGGQSWTSSTECKDTGVSITRCNDVQYTAFNTGTPSYGNIAAFNDPVNNARYFSNPRVGHAAVAANGYLYVLGGEQDTQCTNTASSGYCNDVQYAKINADGTVGSFTTTSSFTDARKDFAAVAYNGYVYITGGALSATSLNCKKSGLPTDIRCNDVQYAKINADGTLDNFILSTNYFPVPRYNHAAVAYNGYLYITGGDSGSSSAVCTNSGTVSCSDVEYAPINADGSIGAFSDPTVPNTVSFFSVPRTALAAVAYNGYFYVVGGAQNFNNTDCKNVGATNDFRCSDIQYAPINASNGTIGSFTNAGYFSTPRSEHVAMTYNGYLYVAGGRITTSTTACRSLSAPSGTSCSDVQYAPINSNGSIGSFSSSVTYFNMARYNQAATVYGAVCMSLVGLGMLQMAHRA